MPGLLLKPGRAAAANQDLSALLATAAELLRPDVPFDRAAVLRLVGCRAVEMIAVAPAVAREACQNLIGIVTSLGKLLPLDEMTRPPRFEAVPPLEIARRLLPQFQERYGALPASVSGDGPLALADSELLERIFRALIDHAYKYGDSARLLRTSRRSRWMRYPSGR